MGLNIEISLDKDIRELDLFFDNLRFKAITLAARQGLNRSAIRVRTLANKEIRKRRSMQLKEVKKRITVKKATGMDLGALEARVNFSGIPLPLILFLVGSKKPRVQKLPNVRRKSLKFQIQKGQKKAKAGLFVQRAQRGKLAFQVFRRSDPNDKSKGFKVQTAPAISELLRTKRNLLRKIENSAIALMQTEYDRALAFQLSKLKL